MARILLTNAVIVTGASSKKGALAIDGKRIAGIWQRRDGDSDDSEAIRSFPEAEVIDLQGKVLMAGGIDAHVHFREPGMEHKADIESESKAALLGGVTSFIDMPNTVPPTTSLDAVHSKLDRASGRSWGNYGFHLGATNDNFTAINEYLASGSGKDFGGVKVFMGSSTGNMLVDNEETLRKMFGIKGKPVLIHSEDEEIIRANLAAAEAAYGEDIPFRMHSEIRSRKACIRSTAKALAMAIEQGTRLHLLHVSTAEEVEMIRAAKIHNPEITAETSANYLWFCDEDYDSLKGRVKCNPAIKTAADREALRKGLAEGVIDTLGSDHAPHLLSEKEMPYLKCPSGLPSIQQSLSVAITAAKAFNEGKNEEEDTLLTLSRITSAFSERPAEIMGIKDRGFLKIGYFADLVVIDVNREYSVKNALAAAGAGVAVAAAVTAGVTAEVTAGADREYSVNDVAYKCGWSPYDGITLKTPVEMVFLNGSPVVSSARLIAPSPTGHALEFDAPGR